MLVFQFSEIARGTIRNYGYKQSEWMYHYLSQWNFSSYYANIVMLEGVNWSLQLDNMQYSLTLATVTSDMQSSWSIWLRRWEWHPILVCPSSNSIGSNFDFGPFFYKIWQFSKCYSIVSQRFVKMGFLPLNIGVSKSI